MAVTIHQDGTPPPPGPGPAETPSQRIVKAANALSYVTDSRGRQLGWRQLDALEDFDLSEVAGGANIMNPKWMLYATIAFAVRDIDGEPVSRPLNRDQLRARIKHLGAEGIEAMFVALNPEPEQPLEDGASQNAPSSEMDRAKN